MGHAWEAGRGGADGLSWAKPKEFLFFYFKAFSINFET
jgi:hypothetical protein